MPDTCFRSASHSCSHAAMSCLCSAAVAIALSNSSCFTIDDSCCCICAISRPCALDMDTSSSLGTMHESCVLSRSVSSSSAAAAAVTLSSSSLATIHERRSLSCEASRPRAAASSIAASSSSLITMPDTCFRSALHSCSYASDFARHFSNSTFTLAERFFFSWTDFFCVSNRSVSSSFALTSTLGFASSSFRISLNSCLFKLDAPPTTAVFPFSSFEAHGIMDWICTVGVFSALFPSAPAVDSTD